MAPHPGLETAEFKDKARKDLLDLIEGVQGKKNLVIEQSLAGPSRIFVKFSTLQQYGVDKIFLLENANVDSSQRSVIFLIRGENADQPIGVTEQIKRLQQSSSIEHEFSVILVPRINLVAKKIFEDAGVLGDISLHELPMYFLPLEQDLLSLELDDSFRDLYLNKDPTCIYTAAKALMMLQRKHGLFPRIIGKGDNAHRLMEILLKMRAEAKVDQPAGSSLVGQIPSADIESLIIIDREVDLGTLMLTQLTYEGLIDEVWGIKDNQAEVETSVVGAGPGQQGKPSTPTQGMKRKILLDSSDKLYEQLRDLNFATVGSSLNKVARRLQSEYEGRHGDKTVPELRDFVSKLPGYQAEQQSVKVHTGLAEEIMKNTRSETFSKILEVQQNLAAGADPAGQHDAIEELVARGAPLPAVLRLLCLESCVAGGIRQKELDGFRSLVCQAYGFQHVLTMDALERMGLLVARTSGPLSGQLSIPGVGGGGVGHGAAGGQPMRTNYSYLRKVLHLIVEEINEADPADIAYVYSGYAPLSVRLVQCVLQKQYLLGFAKSQGAGAAAGGGAGAGAGATGGSGPAGTTNGISTAAHGWQGFEDALKATRGQTFNRVQKGDEAATKARSIVSGSGGKKTVVVMFLGGITRTEIAALRFISNSDPGRKILICTTSVVSGGQVMEAATEKRKFGPE